MTLDERMKYAAMKAKHQKKLRPWYKKPWGIVILSLGSIILISLIIFSLLVSQALQEIKQGENEDYSQEMTAKFIAAVNRPSNNTFGRYDAPVKIVEFADFACPYCQDSFSGLKNIRQKYADDVYIVYRDFPLHENSIFLSLSARCAGEQGKFWQMHDLIFENQERFNVSVSELQIVMPEIASVLELNKEQFEKCITGQKYFSQIEADVDDAEFLQIQGTPTWYINNIPFTGHLSEQELDELVSGILSSQNLKN